MIPKEQTLKQGIAVVVAFVVVGSVLNAAPIGVLAQQQPAQETEPTDTPTEETTETNGTVDYPPGYSASGITDPERAVDQWSSTIPTYANYTYQTNTTTTRHNGDVLYSSQIGIRVSYAENRGLANGTIRNRSGHYHIARYTHTNTQYVLIEGPFSPIPRYNVLRIPFNEVVDTDGLSSFQQYLATANYSNPEFIERDGKTLICYEATELTNASGFFNPSISDENIKTFNSTVVITTEGVIRRFSYVTTLEISGMQMKEVADVRVFALNSTTVEKPDWLDEAKANTSNQITTTAPEQTIQTQTQTVAETTISNQSTTSSASPTITMIPTDTPTTVSTSSPNTSGGNASNGSSANNASGGSSTFGPGFGPVVAVVALLAAALLAVRRR